MPVHWMAATVGWVNGPLQPVVITTVVVTGLAVVMPLLLLCFAPLLVKKRPRVPKVDGEKLNIAFIHPDLGIGGAERLIVDAAVGLQEICGHTVTIFTAHHDKDHCFKETADGTLCVLTYGDFLPRHICRKGHVVFAILRNLYVALRMVLRADINHPSRRRKQLEVSLPFDVVIADQISASIPLLSMTGAKVVFYCHHPDLLLTDRKSLLKKLYRWPMDMLEERTTAMADVTVVNSLYTGEVFKRTFTSIRTTPAVLYPSINFSKYDVQRRSDAADEYPTFLSLNRYERKKNIGLAIHAFARLRRSLLESESAEERGAGASVRLVIAGGYDPRVHENVEYDNELHRLAFEEESIPKACVSFLHSISNEVKSQLMADCAAVLYTPENEHFGIVPIEAMFAGRPVIACNSGGPLESVLHEETGFLFPPEPKDWVVGMREIVLRPARAAAMGEAGKVHVTGKFSLESFTRRLDEIIRS